MNNNMQFNPNMGAFPYPTAPNGYNQNRFNAFAPPTSNAVDNSITWVRGIDGVNAYELAPNSNVLLMDSENEGIFYIRVRDSAGMYNLRTFKYEEITNQSNTYVQKTEFEQSMKEIKEVLKKIEGVTTNGEQSISANDTKPTNPGEWNA